MSGQKKELSAQTWYVDGLFDLARCQDFIQLAEQKGFQEAPITTAQGPMMVKEVRNNTRVIVDSDALAEELWARVGYWVPASLRNRSSVGLNERFRIYRYLPGQRFNTHYDGHYTRANRERSLLTFMIYLNEEFEGGATEFEEYQVEPKTGRCLFFLHHQKHAGTTVTAGCKYVLRSDVMYSPLQPSENVGPE